jgi:hypothetical protein
MRFALRNQDKIAESLGKDYLETLRKSLMAYFAERDEIPEYDIEGGKYRAITVPNSRRGSEIEFVFVIIRKKYDVYNLAYYTSMG